MQKDQRTSRSFVIREREYKYLNKEFEQSCWVDLNMFVDHFSDHDQIFAHAMIVYTLNFIWEFLNVWGDKNPPPPNSHKCTYETLCKWRLNFSTETEIMPCPNI